jgi:hypothetical protein
VSTNNIDSGAESGVIIPFVFGGIPGTATHTSGLETVVGTPDHVIVSDFSSALFWCFRAIALDTRLEVVRIDGGTELKNLIRDN